MALNVKEGVNADPTGNLVYDTDTLSWVRMTQPVVQADVVNISGQVEVAGPLTDDELRASDVKVTLDGENVAVSNFPASQAVTGTFWQSTQPISVASLPLPSGAATEASLALLSKPSDSQHSTLDDVVLALRQVIQALAYPPNIDRSAASARVNVTSGTVTTVSTVTTCTTVTGMTNIDSIQGKILMNGQNLNAWAVVVRSRIS